MTRIMVEKGQCRKMAIATKSSRSAADLSLFDQELMELLKGLRVAGNAENGGDEKMPCEREYCQQNAPPEIAEKSGTSCSVCQVIFDSVETQREHFKLDWHRFNLKQKLMDKPILSEDAFEETISGELSSISGSDSDTDSDKDLSMESAAQCTMSPINDLQPEGRDDIKLAVIGERKHPKVFFVNEDGDVLSVYRTVLYSVKNISITPDATLSLLTSLPKKDYWMILMTAGGHFAGAVFRGKDVLTHKTFHRYTVRAKRGTAQGARDSQQGGKQPKSAGASLRRYNEAALVQEVQDLLEAWSQHVEHCDRIFLRTPAYNKSMFFGGKKPPFKKDDERIRTIPFPTRRPTFKEVKSVHQELSRVQLLGKNTDADVQSLFTQLTQETPVENTTKFAEDKILSREGTQTNENSIEEQGKPDTQESNVKDHADQAATVTAARPQEASKKTKRKKAKTKKSANSQLDEEDEVTPEQHLWNRLYCAVVPGKTQVISFILRNSVDSTGLKDLTGEGVPKAGGNLNYGKSDINEVQESDLENDRKIKRTGEDFDGSLQVKGSESCQFDGSVKKCDKDSDSSENTVKGISSEYTGLKIDELEGLVRSGEEDTRTSSISLRQRKTRVEETREAEQEGSAGDMSSKKLLDVINRCFGEGGETLLHVASRYSRTDIVFSLLEFGADPSVKDSRGRPPFVVACSKETRNEFRRFMASFPDRYDYAKAQIPSALTPEMESEKEKRNTERKKAQKKAQKQRVKEQKALERKKEEEERERKALQALSEREKRALAAEKRFAQQQASKQVGITACCAWCSSSLTGQVPFERLSYKYCSTACVKAHRLDMEAQQR